jgi:hypothetical protein
VEIAKRLGLQDSPEDVKGPVRCFDLEEEEELVGMPSAPKDDQPHFAQKSTSPEQRLSDLTKTKRSSVVNPLGDQLS